MNVHRRKVWVGAAVAGALIVGGTIVGVVALTGGDRGDDQASCERRIEGDQSVARRWNEAVLSAIRSDFPEPTVHARNLYHSSAAMWDAWAAFDPSATGVFVDEEQESGDVGAGREEAMSFAAYRVLFARYLESPGAEEAITRLDDLMADLCYDTAMESVDGDDPAVLGNRIGHAVLADTIDDGSNERNRYIDPDYAPVNPPLIVDQPGTVMSDPNRWQPLELEEMVAQNGLPLTENVQSFVGPHWGGVTSFALPPADERWLPVDPGVPPMLGDVDTDDEFKRSVNEVLRFSSLLGPTGSEAIDISPGAIGNTPLGTYDAQGHDSNPITGEPYEPNLVTHADYGRVIAEFWADGPQSETPPGHWNTVANFATDQLADAGSLRIAGQGDEVDRLEWDTKMYLALNGAVHDSAIAAWGAKGHYDYVRPISMIRYMGGLGQSSDPDGPAFHLDGLLLEPGLVEVVTDESSATGERHEHLGDHVGEIAVRAWQGEPSDVEDDAGEVGWIRAVEWVPYQRSTFVTPAFAAYVSGHSTFSRAGAEVLTAITGSPYFPGGLGEWRVPAGELEFELGPTDDVVLQWATYADAADEAGISRLYGGIHVRADDLPGREMGADIGQAAWEHAQTFFGN